MNNNKGGQRSNNSSQRFAVPSHVIYSAFDSPATASTTTATSSDTSSPKRRRTSDGSQPPLKASSQLHLQQSLSSPSDEHSQIVLRDSITEQLFKVGSCRDKIAKYQQKLDEAANELSEASKTLAELVLQLHASQSSQSPRISVQHHSNNSNNNHQFIPAIPTTPTTPTMSSSSSSSPSNLPNLKTSPSTRSTTQSRYNQNKTDLIDSIGRSRTSTRLQVSQIATGQPCHGRKPKCLLFNPVLASGLIATTSHDGSLRLWAINKKDYELQDIGEISREKLRHEKFISDICWDTEDASLLAASFLDVTPSQVVLVSTNQLPNLKLKFLNCKPHTKEITCCRFANNSSNRLLTGSADHHLVCWDIKKKETMLVHTAHSSAVSALCVPKHMNDTVFSGGADRKLVCYSLAKEQTLFVQKYDEKISAIHQNPVNPDLFLIAKTSKTNQLLLFDTRTNPNQSNSVVRTLSWKQLDSQVSMSQYITPSWNSTGRLIACGSTDPLVHLWDIRASGVELPTQSLSGIHEKRVLRAEFHPTEELTLLTLSSDRNLKCCWFDKYEM